jgi:hypothetical protein
VAPIWAVVGYLAEKVEGHLGARVSYVRSEQDDNVFFSVSLANSQAQRIVDLVVILDGDTIMPADAAGEALAWFRADASLDALVTVTMRSNVKSQWALLQTDEGILRLVRPTEASDPEYARVAVVARTAALSRAYGRIGTETDLARVRKEDSFVEGYEAYLLGWGLLLQLLVDIGCRVAVKATSLPIINVNTIDDLAGQSGG